MNVLSLIRKYGSLVTMNGVADTAFMDEGKASSLKKTKAFKGYTGLRVEVLLMNKAVSHDAAFIIDGIDFLVLETKPVHRNGKVIYSETVLVQDDFVNDIQIHVQSLAMEGCNLPSVEQVPYKTAKARIKTVKYHEVIQYSLQGAKPPTHVFTVFYQSGVATSDLIKWGTRSFEVLSVENVDEQDIFLEMSCIEVLNA